MNEQFETIFNKINLPYTEGDTAYTVTGSDLQKFAELIVVECAKVAWQYTPDTEELEYSHLIKDKILKRFGVEE